MGMVGLLQPLCQLRKKMKLKLTYVLKPSTTLIANTSHSVNHVSISSHSNYMIDHQLLKDFNFIYMINKVFISLMMKTLKMYCQRQ